MSSLLVKDPSEELHAWLRDEAQCNRRSLNQQVLICLEWCMHTHGKARRRNPFGGDILPDGKPLTGKTLARLAQSIEALDTASASEMRTAIQSARKASRRRRVRNVRLD